jgi:hypothetical protein
LVSRAYSWVCFQTREQVLSNRPPCRNDSGCFLGFRSPLLSSFEPSPDSPPGVSHYLPGFRASSRYRGASTSHGVSRSRYVPSSDFLCLSTVCSAPRLAGLFHPATTYRLRLSRGFTPPRSASLSSRAAAPMLLEPFPWSTGMDRRFKTPQLRGFNPPGDPLRRLKANARSPHQVSSSSRYSLLLPSVRLPGLIRS